MGQNHVRAAALVEAEQPIAFTSSVTSESTTIAMDNQDSSIPGPGATYVIRSVSTGKYISLRDEEVSLSTPDGKELTRWECSQHKDWVSFKETTSGMFLKCERSGLGKQWLACSTEDSSDSDFWVRPYRDGSCALLSYIHRVGLSAIGIETVDGNEGFTVINDSTSASISWQFIKVEDSAAE